MQVAAVVEAVRVHSQVRRVRLHLGTAYRALFPAVADDSVFVFLVVFASAAAAPARMLSQARVPA